MVLLVVLLTVTQEHRDQREKAARSFSRLALAPATWLVALATFVIRLQVTTATVSNRVLPLDLALFSHTSTPAQPQRGQPLLVPSCSSPWLSGQLVSS